MKDAPFKITMPGFIVTVLLMYFGLALFGKSIGIEVQSDSPLVQTLINLTIAGSAFFIGTTQGSARKDDVIASLPPAQTQPAEPGTTKKDI